MQVVSLRFVTSPSPDLRHRLREEHFAPPPAFPGFCARHWFLERRAVQGRYLITNRASTECFLRDPFTGDPSVARIASHPGIGRLEAEPLEEIMEDPLVRPVFIVSSPRAGSTLLFELLAKATGLWSIGRESHGVIEGVPKLHPAYYGYWSHRLTEAVADPETIHTLRCAFVAELRDYQGRRYLALQESERPPWIRMLEKTPENALRIPFLTAAFPDALFVYLVRDANQNVSSIIEAWQHEGFVNIPVLPEWGSGDWHLLLPPGWQQYRDRSLAEIAAFQWAAANQAILDDLAALPRDRWLLLDYQTLTTNPEVVLRRLCTFLEVPFDQNLADIVHRPLPLSGTTIRYPSPTRWRYNPDFREAALDPFDKVVQRVTEMRCEMATSMQSERRIPVRFRCFLDELAEPRSENLASPPIANKGQALRVDPSFQFQLGVTIPLPLVRRTRFRERFLADYPIAWVEDSATDSLQPFWVRHQDIWLFRSFVPGEMPSGRVPSRLQGLLCSAGIQVTVETREQRQRFGDTQAREAAEHFADWNYCLLSTLIHPAHLRALGRYYRELISEGIWRLGDPQVAGRYGWHNEMLARFFHHQLTSYVGRVVGIPVKPSYAYVSAYQGGAILERHVDREQCEFTMSLLVECSSDDAAPEWPLYFDTPKGTIEVVQSVGEAVLFRGTKLPHYRPRLGEGQTYTSLLFHYVPANFTHTLY
jgi:Sulfotransferase family